MNENEAATKVVSGLVEYVTFHNAENGFCVLRVKARGHRNLVSIVGHVASISVGEWITASGEWFDDGKFGMQFKARFLKTSAPESVEGIQKYLGSGMINGIGPIYAQKLINTFGKNVFDIIETAPERLRDVDGIGPIRAKKITKAWADQKAIREIMIFLHQHGVGTARAVRIFKTYHNDAIQVMSENPYRMTRDIRGIGFRTADAIAKKLGIEKTSKIRARAGLSFALHESMKNGHCGLPRETLCKLSQELLDLPQDVVQSALDAELLNKTVSANTIADTECIFLTGLYLAEQSIADHIRRIQTRTMPWAPIDTDNALPWVERKIGISLAKNQVKAVSHALKSKVMVITGGPGVGKTTILNAILRILNAKSVRIKLCAPTGRAAKRMSEATGMTAKTIHRLLEFNPSEFKFMRNAHSPLKCDLLVIDESSMVDVRLMKSLLEAIPSTAALSLLGILINCRQSDPAKF